MDLRRLPHTFAPSSWYRFAFTARFMWLRHAVKPVTVKLMHFTQVYWFAAFSASERGRSEHVFVEALPGVNELPDMCKRQLLRL